MVVPQALLNKRDKSVAFDACCKRKALCINFPVALELDSSLGIAYRDWFSAAGVVGPVAGLPDSCRYLQVVSVTSTKANNRTRVVRTSI